MKRVFELFLCLILIFVLSGCSTTTNVDATTMSSLKYIGDRDLKAEFESYCSAKDLLSNISNIDLSSDMGSVSGLELVTEESDDGTSIDAYYRNDDCIYAVYNGYGSNLWKYYTTAVDGTKIVVSFWDEGDSHNAKIELQDENVELPYVIYFYGIDSSYSLGAKTVTVEIKPENCTYAITAIDNYSFISSATYWDENNELHKFEADYDEESKSINYHTDNVIISHDIPTVVIGQEYILAAGLRSANLSETAILLGKHTVYKDAEDNLYVNAYTTLVFEDSDSANVALERLKLISVNAYAFTVEQDGSGKYYLIDIGPCNYGLSESFENGKSELIQYAIDDYDDYTYKAVSLDENMNITAFQNSAVKY